MKQLAKKGFNAKKIFKLVTFALFFLVYLFFIFSYDWIQSSFTALKIFFTTIFPAVLPYGLTITLIKIFYGENAFIKRLNKFSVKTLSVNGYTLYSLILGVISGYPTGGNLASKYYLDNKISLSEASLVFMLTNIPSPLLIITCIGGITFNNLTIGILMQGALIIGTTLTFFIFFTKKTHTYMNFCETKEEFTLINSDNNFYHIIKSLIILAGLCSVFYVFADTLINLPIIKAISDLFSNFFGGSTLFNAIFTGLIETTRGCNEFALLKGPFFMGACILTLTLGGIPTLIFNLKTAKILQIKTTRLFLFKALQSITCFFITYLILLIYLL